MFCTACGAKMAAGARFCAHCGAAADGSAVEATVPRAAPAPTEPVTPRQGTPRDGTPYAGLGARVLALLIDALIVAFAVRSALRGPADWLHANLGLAYADVCVVLLLTLYWPLLEASPLQGTIGKRIVGIRVVGQDGSRLVLVRALVRHLTRFVMLIGLPPLGYVSALGTPRRQAWDDLLSGSVLLRRDATPVEVQAASRPMTARDWRALVFVHVVALTVMYVPLQYLWDEDPGIELRRALDIYPADDPPVVGRGAQP